MQGRPAAVSTLSSFSPSRRGLESTTTTLKLASGSCSRMLVQASSKTVSTTDDLVFRQPEEDYLIDSYVLTEQR